MAFNPDPNVDREGRARRLADSRLSLPTPLRLALATSSSFLVGLGLGLSHGAQSAGFVFRAENAHRLPATPTGWFLYHKSKNYNMALAGVREGVKMGGKLAFWVGLFFAVEDGWDQCRDVKDVANTVLASATVAGAFSAWSKLTLLSGGLCVAAYEYWRSLQAFASTSRRWRRVTNQC
jgi:hypothetical protein